MQKANASGTRFPCPAKSRKRINNRQSPGYEKQCEGKLSTDHAIRAKPQQAIPRSSKQIYAASPSHHSECAASELSPEKTILPSKHRHPLENVSI
jgi:hypothetical protein